MLNFIKSFIILFVIILSFDQVKAQEISIAFNSTHTGRNCAITYIKNIEKSALGMGIRYNINKWAHPDDQMNIFYKRQYATEPLHHLGFQTYFHKYIWSVFYAFYDMQISYSETFNRIYSPYIVDPEAKEPITREDVLYKKTEVHFGPFLWFEQNIGVGLKLNITESIFLSQKIGAGVIMVFGSDEKLLPTMDNQLQWEVSSLMSIAITYRF